MAVKKRGKDGTDQPNDSQETALEIAMKEAMTKADKEATVKESNPESEVEVIADQKEVHIEPVDEPEVIAVIDSNPPWAASEPETEFAIGQVSDEVFSSNVVQESNPNIPNQDKAGKKMSLFNNSFKHSISSAADESLTKYVDNIKLWIKESGLSNVTVDLIPRRKNTAAYIVALSVKQEGTGRTFSHLQFIERFSAEPKVRNRSQGSRNIELRIVLSQEFNKVTKQAVSDYFETRGVSNVTCIGHMVVDSRNELDNNEIAVLNAVTSTMALYHRVGKIGELELKALKGENKELYNTISICPGSTDTNLLGQPIATDFSSTVYVRSMNSKKQESFGDIMDEADDHSDQVLKTNAIVDFVITSPKPQASPNNLGSYVSIAKPVLISTSVEGIARNSDELYEDTGTQLLNAAAMYPMSLPGNWQSIWNRTSRGNGKTSVGVFGMYHSTDPQNAKVPGEIKVAETEDRANEKLVGPVSILNRYCEPGDAIIAFDAIQGERQSWMNANFVREAMESGDTQLAAREAILNVIDKQGNGTFKSNWGAKPILGCLGIVHTGTVRKPDGTDIDVRSIDNLAKMKACNGNVEALKRIMVSGSEHSCKQEYLHDSFQFLKELANFTHKGYAYRLYFRHDFIVAYTQYLKDSGVDVKYDGIMSANTNGLSSGFNTDSWNKGTQNVFSAAGGFSSGSPQNFFI